MAIPRVSKEKILEAIKVFDTTLLQLEEWRSWESNATQIWALVHDGKHYPPKKIISIATGTAVNMFSGGPKKRHPLRGQIGINTLVKLKKPVSESALVVR
jgi:5-methylcytosine-specific restriction protein A